MTMAIYTAYDVEKRVHPERSSGTGIEEKVLRLLKSRKYTQ